MKTEDKIDFMISKENDTIFISKKDGKICIEVSYDSGSEAESANILLDSKEVDSIIRELSKHTPQQTIVSDGGKPASKTLKELYMNWNKEHNNQSEGELFWMAIRELEKLETHPKKPEQPKIVSDEAVLNNLTATIRKLHSPAKAMQFYIDYIQPIKQHQNPEGREHKCTYPNCDCIAKAMEANGGDEVKSFECKGKGEMFVDENPFETFEKAVKEIAEHPKPTQEKKDGLTKIYHPFQEDVVLALCDHDNIGGCDSDDDCEKCEHNKLSKPTQEGDGL